MTRFLHALRAALLCAYRGFRLAMIYPALRLHVVASDLSGEQIFALIKRGAEAQGADEALAEDTLAEAGTELLEREMGEGGTDG